MRVNEPRDHFKHQRDTFGTFTPENDEDWAAARTQCIGGSDISTVMGCWGRERFNELLEQKRTGVQFFTGNLTTELGSDVERFIFRKYREGAVENAVEMPSADQVEWNKINAIRFDEDDKRFSCTPDIELADKIKPCVYDLTAVVNMKFTAIAQASMPTDYMRMQVNWEMMVTRCELGGILALGHGRGTYLRYFQIERDAALIAKMRRAATIFMDGVESGSDGAEIAKAIGIAWTPAGSIKGKYAKKRGPAEEINF